MTKLSALEMPLRNASWLTAITGLMLLLATRPIDGAEERFGPERVISTSAIRPTSVIAVDLVTDKKTREPIDPANGFSKKLADVAQREGVIVRAVGPKLIISPPLIFSKANVDELVAALRMAFDEIDK